MAFLLAADGRDDDVAGAFERYRVYLSDSRGKFPPRAFELATSDWYFDFQNHRSPHDGWLESMALSEWGVGERNEARGLTLTIRLLGAWHDGHIEFRYPEIHAYKLEGPNAGHGHADWRYDEFRLSAEGHLIHEIEWSGPQATGRWLIEASDIDYRWIPAAGSPD